MLRGSAGGCAIVCAGAERSYYLGARVSGIVDGEEPCRIDRGVALRRRQAGMAEQFLDGAQIAAPGQQVRRETVTQRMRRR